jgi:hypothetical protein
VGLEAIHELNATVAAAEGDDWNAGLAERVDVAQDGSLGDLERLGELACRHPPSALQEQQHVEHTGSTHI